MTVDIIKVRENLAQQESFRQEQLDLRFSKATSECAEIVKMIKTRYNPLMIVQWGSLLDRTLFTEISDIDIALMGISSSEIFFDVLKQAEKLTSFSLDIVQLDKIDPLNRESILSKGKIVYERNI